MAYDVPRKHKNPLIILLSKSNRVDVHILRGCAKWTTVILITLSTSASDIGDFYNLFHLEYWSIEKRINHPVNIIHQNLYCTHNNISHERRQNINKRSIVNLSKTVYSFLWRGLPIFSCWEMIYIFLTCFFYTLVTNDFF